MIDLYPNFFKSSTNLLSWVESWECNPKIKNEDQQWRARDSIYSCIFLFFYSPYPKDSFLIKTKWTLVGISELVTLQLSEKGYIFQPWFLSSVNYI